MRCAAVLFISANRTQAQGVISFASSDSGLCVVTNQTTLTSVKIATGEFAFSPYIGSTATEALNSTTPVLTFVTTSFPGIISSAQFTVNAMTGGATYYFQVRGWRLAAGDSFEQAAQDPSAFNPDLGITAIGTITPLPVGDLNAAPRLFGTGPGQVLVPIMGLVPEPTASMIGGLGIVALAFSHFSRRRK